MSKSTTWSFSRLDKYVRCPLAYKLNYIDKKRGKPNDAMRFGSMMHKTLERMYKQGIEDELDGPWDHEQAINTYRYSFNESGISGLEPYAEGLAMLNDYLHLHSGMTWHNVLAVEPKFEIDVGDCKVMGYIDRIDRIDDRTIRVVDYKTNRMLYSQDDLSSNLQLSIYAMAARSLYPWATNVELEFDMLRHGCSQQTVRRDQDLATASSYIETIVDAVTSSSTFEPKLNTLCGWCDHRHNCDAYQTALVTGDTGSVVFDANDLDGLSEERQRVAAVIKIAEGRKKEIDAILKGHIETSGEFQAGGQRYHMAKVTSMSYPLSKTVNTVTELTGIDADSVRDKITVVDKRKLTEFLKKVGDQTELSSSQLTMLKVELQTLAKKRYSERLYSKKVSEEQ